MKKNKLYLIITILIALIPTSFIIHIIAKDFVGYYFQAFSFLKYHGYAYQLLSNHCNNPINTGLNARAPFLPLIMAISFSIFGSNLLGLYLPFFIARLLIFPITYLVAKYYLPNRFALFTTLLLLFIPKLQTYSFGALEADIFVALFYLLATYFYLKSNGLKKLHFTIFSAICLSLGALSKPTGFGILVGFIIAIFLSKIKILNQKEERKKISLFIVFVVLFLAPYFLWTLISFKQLYLSTHNDRSLSYITTNFPSLITTVPLYFGIDFNLGLKGKLVSSVLLLLLFIGLIESLIRKDFILIFPTLFTLLLISVLSPCLIGWNIPANYEFITILGFTMIPVSIIFIVGAYEFINNLWLFLFKINTPQIILTILFLVILFKFSNNYFTARYALDYIPNEYYISLPTIIKNKESLPEVEFEIKNNLRIFTGPKIHTLLEIQFYKYRFDPFSSIYKQLIFIITLATVVVFIFG